jgi:hypothetical protein
MDDQESFSSNKLLSPKKKKRRGTALEKGAIIDARIQRLENKV